MQQCQPGDILFEKYQIEALISRGAFGEVYRVTHLSLNVPRALKVLRRDAPRIGSTDFDNRKERFQQEAQLGASLHESKPHANLLHVYDFQQEGKTLVLEMEYAAGGSLKETLDGYRTRRTIMPVETGLQIAAEIAAGLSHLHAHDIVHRDLKPANILFGASGQVKIADLGIAQTPWGLSGRTVEVSLASEHPGTPGYKSPEQEHTTGYLKFSSDVYALGLVLFEMLTGRTCANQPAGTQPRSLNPDVPPGVNKLVMQMLAESPAQRPADGAAAAQALARLQVSAANRIKPIGMALGGLAIIVLLGFGLVLGAKTLWQRDPEPTHTVVAVSEIEPTPTRALPTAEPEIKGASEPALEAAMAEIPTAAPEPTPTHTAPSLPTDTPAPTETSAPTASPTPTLTETSAPSLAVGSTQVSPRDGMVLVYVPEGEFLMGASRSDGDADSDEFPQRQVYLDAFWIDQTEATNAMFSAFVEDTGHQTEAEKAGSSKVYSGGWQTVQGADWQHPSGPSSSINDKENHPVVHVSWHDAKAYCEWAGRRLPTEAEWEKAARGEDGLKYPFGGSINCSLAQYNDCGYYSVPVGEKQAGASPYGAYEMAGNVWEWVADWYGSYSGASTNNPTGPGSGEYKVQRGGSWRLPEGYARSTNRSEIRPYESWHSDGFRCAQDAAP